MNRKTLYVILGIVIVAAVAGGLIWRSRQQSARAARENLRSAVAERGDMLVTVSASGHIKPVKQAEISFEASGQIAEVLVEVGDEVQAGDVLARLDVDRPTLEADRARANLAAAEAQLAKLRVGARKEEIEANEANLRAADAQLSATAAERDQVAAGSGQPQIAAAEAEVASALTEQKKAHDLHEKTMECFTFKISKGDPIKELPTGEVITATESIEREICPLLGVPEEQARYRLEAADEALEAARARLEEVKDGASQDQLRAAQANVASAASQRDAAQAQLDLLLEGATEEQISAAEARVDQARAALRQAELGVEQTVLEAPFDATVGAVHVSTGEQASAGSLGVTLVDASGFHVNVAVDELDVGRLERGQTVRLTFDALPDVRVTGTVQQIATAAGVDGGVVTYEVRIDLEPTDAPIRADMTTNATVIVAELTDVVKIPAWAVRVDRDTGQYYVNRRVGDDLERVDVRLGVRSEGVAQVLDGLSAGDEIVRAPESSPFDFGAE